MNIFDNNNYNNYNNLINWVSDQKLSLETCYNNNNNNNNNNKMSN